MILGGGYVAITAAQRLGKHISDGLEVSVVNRQNFHTYHGFVSEMLTGKVQPGQIMSAGRRIFGKAHLHVGEVQKIDLERREVIVGRHLDGREKRLPYDHLVISVGAMDNLTAFPGAAAHAFRLRSYEDIFKLRDHIVEMLEVASNEPDLEERRRLLTFVVAGAGYAGTEMAACLRDQLNALVKKVYRGLRLEDTRVVMICSGQHVLPELHEGPGAAGYGNGHPRLVAKAEERLRRLGVEILPSARVACVTPSETTLQDGRIIATRTLISTVGTKMNPLLDTLELPCDQNGRLITDATGLVSGTTNIWASGDCASVPHPAGGLCPAVATYALEQGKVIAANILRSRVGKPLQPFKFTGLGQACAMGGQYAVAELKGIEMWGFPAWVVLRIFLLYYIPTWERRIRIVQDWITGPFVGRDIVSFRVGLKHGIKQAHFEPGNEIVKQGDVGRQVYLIRQGEVEVVHHNGGHEQLITRLGPGQRFGIGNSLLSGRLTRSVRAVTAVDLTTIGISQARDLAQALGHNELLEDQAEAVAIDRASD